MLIGTKTESTIVHEEEIPFEYEIEFDPSLKPGEKVVDQEGKAGSKTTTYKIENSQVVGEPEVYKTEPVKAIIRVGDEKFNGKTSHEVTEETKFITIIEKDDNLPFGQTKEVQEGKRGSKTTKYTQKFENGVPGEIKEEVVSETPAVNRIIKVGTKTVTEHISKEITEKIPYGVKIEYDNTMPAGKTRVKTKGEAGSKTTEYYRNLINGKFDGDLNEREVTDKYKAPVDEVIVVGTKVETNSEEYKNDVTVEIEKVEDPDLYKGIVNEGELTPGKVERKIVNEYDPETGKVSTKEEVVVSPAKQKIIVGTKDFTGEFSHTIEKTLPFEREIQYDDSMEAGTQKVTQKGQTGQSEQTVTQKYKNGVIGDKEFSKTVTKKEPVKEILKIGTKAVEKIVEIPFNTEYVYDNTIDAGTVVEDKNHMGKAGSVTVKTYFDKELGKFVSAEDDTSKIGPVNKIIRVGTKPTENMCPAPGIPGNQTPHNPVGDQPNNPETPDGNNPSPENHVTPEDETPSDPHTPGETPNNPGKPGEDKPKVPGENPENPQEQGKTEEENPVNKEIPKEIKVDKTEEIKENPNELSNRSKKSSEADELSKKTKKNSEANELSSKKKMANPKTGIGSVAPIITSMGLSIVGLLATKKKKKEDQ